MIVYFFVYVVSNGGAFAAVANAETLKHRLEQRGFRNVVIRYDARSESPLYRVRVGPVRS